MKGEMYVYYIGDKQLEDKDVILASCELCIDTISKLHADIQLDVLSELHGYITEKISQLHRNL
jgi:hypothetical protein